MSFLRRERERKKKEEEGEKEGKEKGNRMMKGTEELEGKNGERERERR